MTPEQFKIAALAHLDRCDDTEAERIGTEQPGADLFAELHRRYQHAHAAFPGMSWEEFNEIAGKRHRKGKPGISKQPTADDKLWLAVRDSERIKSLWKQIHPISPRPRPPIHPHELVAERHGVLRQSVDDRVNRPKSRRPKAVANTHPSPNPAPSSVR